MDDKNRAIGEMFSRIAPMYDLLNRLLSAGIDRQWRRAAVAEMSPALGGRHLDLATGTADMALEIVRQKRKPVFIAGADISPEMLRIGRSKCVKAGADAHVFFVRAPGESLPFRDAVFDSACVAFGIRNIVDRSLGLREMCRVVRPGGRIVILEFSMPQGRILGSLYRFYFTQVLPRIGAMASSNRDAYQYLPESVLAFPKPLEFKQIMLAAGCSSVTSRPLTFGIVTLYVGTR
ncbi:MAG: bifunctional demethylmenaquinone methyltransferase/2-methoxy-6-polyprenyl-1,4-benzoquinol methylase UbiE [Syntrophorhabdaceae bacterium]|nr:bifunctional demethylmenaquinone methyltransferase/2-methoxy-6-polyprenyl-1,4-benzoquinol methylase UbiE [Syntrophorhabdaceae bacterium]